MLLPESCEVGGGVIMSAMGHPALGVARITVLSGFRIAAVSAMKRTPQKTIVRPRPARPRRSSRRSRQRNLPHPAPRRAGSVGEDHGVFLFLQPQHLGEQASLDLRVIDKRRDRAELGHDARHGGDHGIDIGVGGVARQGESGGAVGEGVGESHGEHHVRRFERTGRAGGARRRGDAEFVKVEQDRLALDGLEADIEGGGEPLGLMAVELCGRAGGKKRRFEPVPQLLHACGIFGHMLPRELGRAAEADDESDILGAGAQAAFLVAAVQERIEVGAFPDEHGADALGRMQLVSGKRQEVEGVFRRSIGTLPTAWTASVCMVPPRSLTMVAISWIGTVPRFRCWPT